MISPAGVLESAPREGMVGETRAQWEDEQVASARSGFEVVALPVRALRGVVPLHHPIVARDSTGIEARPNELSGSEILGDVHPQLLLENACVRRQLQQRVVERRT